MSNKTAVADVPAALPEDPRFVWWHGFLVFTGSVEDVPDHRATREERIEAFVKAVTK